MRTKKKATIGTRIAAREYVKCQRGACISETVHGVEFGCEGSGFRFNMGTGRIAEKSALDAERLLRQYLARRIDAAMRKAVRKALADDVRSRSAACPKGHTMSGEKDWADRIALGIVSNPSGQSSWSILEAKIAEALRAERARWSAFAGADGEPRRVIKSYTQGPTEAAALAAKESQR